MKSTLVICLMAACLSAETACQTPRQEAAKEVVHRPQWHNLYTGDPALAGVILSVYTERDIYEKDRKTGHPGVCDYLFWDGRVRSMVFDARGMVLEDYWQKDPLKPRSNMWCACDFRLGSDPEFVRHHDPRPKCDPRIYKSDTLTGFYKL